MDSYEQKFVPLFFLHDQYDRIDRHRTLLSLLFWALMMKMDLFPQPERHTPPFVPESVFFSHYNRIGIFNI